MDDLYLHDLHSDKTLWRDFSKFLTQKNINGKAIPWYIRRAQFFLSKTRNTRLSELTLERVIQYLSFISRDSAIDDWQINQSVDAVNL